MQHPERLNGDCDHSPLLQDNLSCAGNSQWIGSVNSWCLEALDEPAP